jgi:hypothetical protein
VKRTLVSVLLSLAGLLALDLLSPRDLLAASPNRVKDFVVEDFDVVVPAAEGCGGESVQLLGTLEVVVQTTTDSLGGMHATLRLNPRLTGVGLSTGLEYASAGPAVLVTEANGAATSLTAPIELVHLTSPGSRDSLVIHETMRVTVNEDGTAALEFVSLKTDCGG